MSEPNWENLRREMGDNVVEQIPLDELARDRIAMLAAGTRRFEETKIKRWKKGTKTAGKIKGGRFAPKGATGGEGAPEDEEAKKKADASGSGPSSEATKQEVGAEGADADVYTISDREAYRRVLAKAMEPPPPEFQWPAPLPETAEKLGFGDASDVRELDHVKVQQEALSLDDRPYTPERLAEHDAIIAYWIAQSGAVVQENPMTLFMAGGSGAGKTSVLGKQLTDGSGRFEGGVLQDIPENAVYINPDEIKEQLREYNQMIELGDPGAASFVHEESSDISKKLLAAAEAKGYNVVLDGTGDSAVGKFHQKVQKAQSLGRGVRVAMVDIPTDKAIQRATLRAQKSGRMVPTDEIRLVHKNVSANFAQWQEHVPDWELWDNSSDDMDDPPVMIASRKSKKAVRGSGLRYSSRMERPRG